jgi:hypothetical protein
MRKIVAAEFLSLDGVMESPDKWHFPYWVELCHSSVCRVVEATSFG